MTGKQQSNTGIPARGADGVGRYDGVDALVLGAGVSGEAAARLLLARGGRVTVLDENGREEVAARLRTAGAECVFGGTGVRVPPPVADGTTAPDVCVVSPGFALGHPWVAECRRRGIPLISELELGGRYWSGKLLAVTGSKGKSSLVKLCADALNGAGVGASPAGNYGIPLCRLALERPELAWAVVEVSSFQMEHTWTFSPEIAVLLNFQADHLDRHADMAEYKALKLKLFSAMRPGSLALLPAGFDAGDAVPAGVVCERFGAAPFAAGTANPDWMYTDHAVTRPEVACHLGIDLRGSWFDNEVLGAAAAAGAAALTRAGLDARQIQAGFAGFQPLPHRVQEVAVSGRGVRFVDDSKATSLAATAAALRMVRKPVRLIAGGLLKEKDLDGIKELLTQTTKKVYLIGQCAEQMFQAWSASVPCEACGTLERAVASAARESQSGETVLLSPGTASFDQFTSYRERGERFAELVRAVADL
jgi:UDP-N-acetylmuramoylalanine--D-glutamate ligase